MFEPPHVIEMTAKTYEFNPSPIHIKAGQTVELKVTATDKTHGIKINVVPDGAAAGAKPGLEIPKDEECLKLDKNQTVTIQIVAHDPGTYSFACCKLCGLGHKKMKGQIIVDP